VTETNNDSSPGHPGGGRTTGSAEDGLPIGTGRRRHRKKAAEAARDEGDLRGKRRLTHAKEAGPERGKDAPARQHSTEACLSGVREPDEEQTGWSGRG